MPLAFAVWPDWSMASTHSGFRVPILRTKAEAMAAMSFTSSRAWAIIGEAPTASRALAVLFITTKLVMLCTSGLFWRTAARSDEMDCALIIVFKIKKAVSRKSKRHEFLYIMKFECLSRFPPLLLNRSGSGVLSQPVWINRHPQRCAVKL